MKFNQYVTFGECGPGPEVRKKIGCSLKEFYGKAFALAPENVKMTQKSHGAFLEFLWLAANRPFYNVYPAVVKCLQNTSLQVKPSQVQFDLEVVSICFAEGHEPMLVNDRVKSMLFSVVFDYEDFLRTGYKNELVFRILLHMIGPSGEPRFCMIQTIGDDLLSERKDELGEKAKFVSLAVGIALLAKDPKFAEPILLQRDQHRTFATDEARNAAIERAKKRGRFGFEIGKDMEVSPHMRRPHFSIRWTGKGAEVPKLVPVKGSIVNKTKLFPIPTGYMDSDSGEAGTLRNS
jgi:heme exporter protein D